MHREYTRLENTSEVQQARAEAKKALKLTAEYKPVLLDKLARAMAARDEALRQHQLQESEARRAHDEAKKQAMEAEAHANVQAAVARAAGTLPVQQPPVSQSTTRNAGSNGGHGYTSYGGGAAGSGAAASVSSVPMLSPAPGAQHTASVQHDVPPPYHEAIHMPGPSAATPAASMASSAAAPPRAPRSMDELYAQALNMSSLSTLPSARSQYEAEMRAPSQRQLYLSSAAAAATSAVAGGQHDALARPTRAPPVTPGGDWMTNTSSSGFESLVSRVVGPWTWTFAASGAAGAPVPCRSSPTPSSFLPLFLVFFSSLSFRTSCAACTCPAVLRPGFSNTPRQTAPRIARRAAFLPAGSWVAM